jgi:type I restriction enzyme R subunit
MTPCSFIRLKIRGWSLGGRMFMKSKVNAEKEIPQEEDEDRGKTALTSLFEEIRTSETPIAVQRIVDDIDDIVRKIRFPEWQATNAGERQVCRALRRTLFKYKLHKDTELFEKEYGYVKEYY